MQRSNQSGSTGIPKPPPPPPIHQKQFSEQDNKIILPISKAATLPVLRSVVLQVGEKIQEDKGIALHMGVYDGRPVAIQQMSIEAWIQHQDAWTALYRCHSPFWLPVLGTCEQSKQRLLVTAALPEMQWSHFLTSSAADVWSARCRVVRDVAVGLYQRRAAGATHIAWDTRHLNLDAQGRAQLFPLLREIPMPESDDVFALGQLLWQMASRSTVLLDSWQQSKGLPHDCPPAVVALIQACTNPVVTERPSLRALAKGLDFFWQRAMLGFLDANPTLPGAMSPAEKERKYDPPTNPPSSRLAQEIGGLYTAFQPASASSTASTTSSVNQSLTDSVLASGSLSTLLIDDQTVSWLTPTDPRYQVSLKLCALRDSLDQPTESKASLPRLQQTIQTTLLESNIEMLLWLGANGTDPRAPFTETAGRLWQASEWQAYRPGDPPPTAWLPLFISLHHAGGDAPLFTHNHRLITDDIIDFTETEWQVIEQHYRPFWLVQGIDQLETSPNLYDTNELHRAQGHARLLLHSASSHVFKLEESTALMPHDTEGRLLPSRYARYTTEDLSTWEGCYQGVIGLAAQTTVIPDTNPLPLSLTPEKDLALHRDQLVLPLAEDSKSVLGKGAFGEVLQGTYYGQPVAIKRFGCNRILMLPDDVEPGISPNNDLRTLYLRPEKSGQTTAWWFGDGAFDSHLVSDENQKKMLELAAGSPEILRSNKCFVEMRALCGYTQWFKETRLSPSNQAQLKDEAAVMANLQSPFLIGIFGLSLDVPPLLVMELAPGGSLYNVLKDGSQGLPWSQRLRLLRDIALGLSVLHAHELLHRDLKSLNILLDVDGRAKLCDFGLSTLKSQAKETSEVGTRLWNAPEVLQGKAATPASDMYSFAIVCWEVAACRVPYQMLPWKNEVVQRVQQGQREIIPTDCLPELAIVIQACWAQDPSARPSAIQVTQVLEGLWQAAVLTEQFTQSLLVRQPSLESKPPVSSHLTDENFPSLITAGTPVRLFSTQATSVETKKNTAQSQQTLSSDFKSVSFVAKFKTLLTKSSVSSWQDKLLPQYTLGLKLLRLRQGILLDPYITQELTCFISPNGQSQPGQSPDPLYPWVERELLKSPVQVLALFGLAGAGKSTFNRYLLRTLWQDPAWQSYRLGDPLPKTLLPIWIPLGSSQVKHNDLWGYCQQYGFTHAEIASLRLRARVIFIADGYDEIPGGATPNLFDLNFREDKNTKLIIGCRSQRFHTLSEAEAFVPHTTTGGSPTWTCYRSRYVAPFTSQQTQDYIDKYVAQHQNNPDRPKDWDAARYKKEFAAFPELQTLIDTPFMLWMTLSILPQLASDKTTQTKNGPDEDIKGSKEIKEPKSARTRINRAALYDRFMEIWFGRQARKAWQQRSFLQDPASILGKTLMQALKIQASQTGSEDVQVHWLQASYRLYCLRLAEQLTQAGKVSLGKEQDRETKEIKRSDKDPTDWLTMLLSDSPDSQHLRQGSPLRESSDRSWGFMHASLLDYFLTTAITEALLLKGDITASNPFLFTCTRDQAIRLLIQAYLTPEQVGFLIDRVKNDFALQEAFFSIIEESKTDKSIALASANAATVLNACRISFAGRDWRKVNVPGANLMYGMFTRGNFKGANFQRTILRHTIWYGANLDSADLRHVRWGEGWSRVELTSWAKAIAAHPTQPWLAATQDNDIILLDQQTTERIGRPFEGHTVGVECIAFSPDGRYLVSGSFDKTLILWEVETRQSVHKPFVAHTGGVRSVTFSPDGKLVASTGHEGTVRLWDIVIGCSLKELPERCRGTHVAFSPDGKLLIWIHNENVYFWDRATKHLIENPLGEHIFKGVSHVKFSPNGKLLILGSQDGVLYRWDMTTQTMIEKPFVGHTGEITSVAFSLDEKSLVSGSMDGTLRLWDVVTGFSIGDPFTEHTSTVTSVVFSTDGQFILSGGLDRTVRLWDFSKPPPIGEGLIGHSQKVTSIAISLHEGVIVSSSHDKTLLFWDIDMKCPMSVPLKGHSEAVNCVVFSPDGKFILSASDDNTLILWDVTSRYPVGEPFIGHTGHVSCVAFSTDGKHFASGSWDKTVCLWEIKERRPLRSHFKWCSYILMLDVLPEEKKDGVEKNDVIFLIKKGGKYCDSYLLYIDKSHSQTDLEIQLKLLIAVEKLPIKNAYVFIWSGQDFSYIYIGNGREEPIAQIALKPSSQFEGLESLVSQLDFRPEKRGYVPLNSEAIQIITSNTNFTRKLIAHWYENGQKISHELNEITTAKLEVYFQPGKFLKKGEQGFAEITSLCGYLQHKDSVTSVEFSSDGELLVSGSWDKTLCIWNVKTGYLIWKKTHQDKVNCVVFSPHGKFVVSASGSIVDSRDNSVRLWNISNINNIEEKEKHRFTGHTGAVTSVRFTQGGQYIVSGSRDQTVRLWDVVNGLSLAILHWSCPIWSIALSHVFYKPISGQHTNIFSSESSKVTPYQTEEDMLVMGDELGTISFWIIRHEQFDFLSMPHHYAMPLLVENVSLDACVMSQLSKRLWGLHRADVSKVVVEDKITTSLTLETKLSPSSTHNKSIHKSSFFSELNRLIYSDQELLNQANQELLSQANQLIDEIYPRKNNSQRGARQRYLAKLDYYRKKINTLNKTDQKQLKELVNSLQRLHNNPASTPASQIYLTSPKQKPQSKLSFSLKPRLWSSPKPQPSTPATSSSASSSSSSSSSTLYSSTSSSLPTSTSSTSTTTFPHT